MPTTKKTCQEQQKTIVWLWHFFFSWLSLYCLLQLRFQNIEDVKLKTQSITMTSQWLPRPEDQSKIFCTSLPTAIILRELAPPGVNSLSGLIYYTSTPVTHIPGAPTLFCFYIFAFRVFLTLECASWLLPCKILLIFQMFPRSPRKHSISGWL